MAQYVATAVKISLPLDRTVYQQNSSSQASFVLAGQVQGYFPNNTTTVNYKIERLKKDGTFDSIYLDWTNITFTALGFFNQNINNLPTGWYRINLRYENNFTSSIKVGVGEVIFVAGQSNAQGIDLNGRETTIPDLGVNYDCLNAVNETCWCQKTYKFPEFKQMIYSTSDGASRIAPNGNKTLWAYQALGKRIVDRNNNVVTPIMFFNAGATGSSISNWYDSAINENAITNNPLLGGTQNCQINFSDWNSEGPEGHPYRGLRTGLNYYGSMTGTRGVIWHQGESDTKVNTSQGYYNNALEAIIGKTREHYSNNLGWAISRVSRLKDPDNGNIITSNAVKAAQQSVKENATIGNTRWGAYYSDEIIDRITKDNDLTHFNSSGLLKLAELYDTGNFAGNTAGGVQGGDILSLSPVESNKSPTVTVTKNGNNVTIALNNSYSSYRWVKNEGKLNSAGAAESNATLTVDNASSTDRWRCYALDSKRNIVISQEVAFPIASASVLGTGGGGGTTIPQTESNCPTGSYTTVSRPVSCDAIFGWAFKSNSSQNSGEVILYVDNQRNDRITANSFAGYTADNGTYVISYEGYYKGIQNALWKDGLSHRIRLFLCGQGTPFVDTQLTCPKIYDLFTSNESGLSNVSASGATGSFNVNATSVTWTISGVPSWASINQVSGGNGNTNINVTFQTNTGAARSASLTISGTNGVNNQNISISQQATSGSTCSFTEGQYLFHWYGENIYAHQCGTKYYVTTDAGSGGYLKPRSWLMAASYAQAACFEENDPRPAGCGGGGGGSGGGSGGGGCSFTDGQFLLDWYGETIQAKFCNGVLYARATWGNWKSQTWLMATGMNPATAACFADYNPGCGASGRMAAMQPEETDNKIVIYPNPTTGKVKIVFSLQKAENVWLNLYDVQGKSLDLRDFEGKTGSNEVEYDLQSYPSGAYFVDFQSTEKREILKVIKAN